MKIDDSLRANLKELIFAAGGAKNFAKKCGIHPSNLSRYQNKKIKHISDENWQKLLPFLSAFSAVPPQEIVQLPSGIPHSPQLHLCLTRALDMHNYTLDMLPQLLNTPGADYSRIISGDMPWPPSVLAALLDILFISREKLPLQEEELKLLPAAGIFRNGAILMRQIPVIELQKSQQQIDKPNMAAESGHNMRLRTLVPIPADIMEDIRAFRINDNLMSPALNEEDIVLSIPTYPENIPDNKIVIASVRTGKNKVEVLCRRFHRTANKSYLLTADNPHGTSLSLKANEIKWIDLAVRRMSSL